MRFPRPMLALAAITVALPAAADDGRRHVMTPTQKIDMVRDLPDIAAFERDGMYFDLGYIYPIHTVNGASVASASGGDSGFVLYHDDRYIRADSGIMADLAFVLGEDPTQGYTPPVPVRGSAVAADPWGANGTTDTAKGEPIKSLPAPARRSGGMGWIAVFVAFIFLMAVRWARNMLVRGVVDMVSGGGRRPASFGADYPSHDPGGESFDARVAARLAERHGDPAPIPTAYQPPAASGGFGRKGL